jgi:drug/metabolite transporter (DMT)-like permease
LFAGLLWSFGPLVVRHMDNPHLVPWQYIFGRGLTIFILLNLYLFFEEGKNFYKNYLKIGLSGIIGGSGLGVAMITFIYSITNTSAAVTLLCLAAMPFFTALLAFLFLRERISFNVWISIILASVGILIMAIGNTGEKSLAGFIFGLTSSIGFSIFSVTLRWKKETPKFTTVAFSGLFCFIFASIVILIKDQVFFASSYNGSLFSLHGTLVCFGLILYSIGSKAIPAAELTLLSLTEVVGGIFWVWLPIFGINEVPSTNTIIGGFFLFVSLIYYSLIMKWNKRYIALN